MTSTCPRLSVEFGDQYLGRRQAIGPHQDRFDFRPVDLRRIEPQPYPSLMTDVLWDVKSVRGIFRQLLGDAARSLAVNGEPDVTVVVIQVPAEALLAYFKAQVVAGGYNGRIGKPFHNCDNSRSPFGGDLTRHFERRLIHSFILCITHHQQQSTACKNTVSSSRRRARATSIISRERAAPPHVRQSRAARVLPSPTTDP